MAGSLSDSRPSGSPREKNVSFADEAGVRYITARALPQRSSVKMTDRRFQKFDSGDVTDDLLQQASQLFSRNYGVWGHEAGSSLSGLILMLNHEFQLTSTRYSSPLVQKPAAGSISSSWHGVVLSNGDR